MIDQKPMPRFQRHAIMIREICDRHGVSFQVVCGPDRDRQATMCRREICLALREEGLSSTQIGRIVKRDHTTVLWLTGSLKKSKWKSAA